MVTRDYKVLKMTNLLYISSLMKPRESFLWWIDWNLLFTDHFWQCCKVCVMYMRSMFLLCCFYVFCVIFKLFLSFLKISVLVHFHWILMSLISSDHKDILCLVFIFTMTNSLSNLLDWFSLLTRGVKVIVYQPESLCIFDWFFTRVICLWIQRFHSLKR